MTQTTQTITPVASGPILQPVPVRRLATTSVAAEAKASVDRLVALNANLLAAA